MRVILSSFSSSTTTTTTTTISSSYLAKGVLRRGILWKLDKTWNLALAGSEPKLEAEPEGF